MNKPLGCLTGAGLFAAGLTALALAAVAVAGGNAMFSPGKLNAVSGAQQLGGVASHADLSADCAGCHAAPWSGDMMGDRCMDCHTDMQAELADPTSLHFSMASSANCRDCHTEHHGAAANLTRNELVGFPHERTGYSLLAHPVDDGEFMCLDCHVESLRTFAPDTCRICHQLLDSDFAAQHLADFGDDCLACHDGVDRYGGEFAHAVFTLDGKHLEVDCSACHLEARTIADLESLPQACVDCHNTDDIHAGRLGGSCHTCHTTAGWEGATLDHQLTGFALRGAHNEVDCEGCHVDRQWTGLPTNCAGCHQPNDPHRGQFSQDCSACHVESAWSDLIFDHARTHYALVGAHLQADCTGCHQDGRYVDTPTACIACHRADDEHNGRFGEDCSACHRPTEWSDVTFDHALSNFPLTGAHRNVSCENCHAGGSFAGTPTACSACHAEPAAHLGMFGTNCASCHSTSAWLPASFNGPHTFPINHKGANGNCSTCHPSSLLSYTCYGCHEHDPAKMQQKHEGVSNLADCARCHPNGSHEGSGGDD